jgi:ferrous iron transport protein A
MNTCCCPLCQMQEGQTARVREVRSTGSMQRRLLDMGLIAGTPVACLQKSPGGDPVAYLIRGAVIAIRHEDSANILVEPVL